MTPAEFAAIQKASGMSDKALAEYLRVNPRLVRRIKDGEVPVSGPISVLMEGVSGV